MMYLKMTNGEIGLNGINFREKIIVACIRRSCNTGIVPHNPVLRYANTGYKYK